MPPHDTQPTERSCEQPQPEHAQHQAPDTNLAESGPRDEPADAQAGQGCSSAEARAGQAEQLQAASEQVHQDRALAAETAAAEAQAAAAADRDSQTSVRSREQEPSNWAEKLKRMCEAQRLRNQTQRRELFEARALLAQAQQHAAKARSDLEQHLAVSRVNKKYQQVKQTAKQQAEALLDAEHRAKQAAARERSACQASPVHEQVSCHVCTCSHASFAGM